MNFEVTYQKAVARLGKCRDLYLIARSGLFDREWYLANNPDVAAMAKSPLLHYLRYGAQEGRDPSPLFDAKWYLARNPDVARAPENPLVHYLRNGAREGRDPNPHFNARRYFADNSAVAASGQDPLVHFLLQRGKRRARPFFAYVSDGVVLSCKAASRLGAGCRHRLFVAFLIWKNRRRERGDLSSAQLRWLSPCEMRVEALEGVFRRTFNCSSPPSKKPIKAWPIDRDSAARIVIPIVAPARCLRRITIAAHGRAKKGCCIALSLAKTPHGPAVADGIARYHPATGQLVWRVCCGVLEPGGQYFLRMRADRWSGLHLIATDFDVANADMKWLEKIVFDPEVALPCDWATASDRSGRTCAVLVAQTQLDRGGPQFVDELQTIVPEVSFHLVGASGEGMDALDLVGRCGTVLIEETLASGSVLGLRTTDLTALLRIQGTDVIPFSLGMTSGAEVSIAASAVVANVGGDTVDAVVFDKTDGAPWRKQANAVASIAAEVVLGANKSELPHVAIVTIVYRKVGVLTPFLRAVYRQSYPGPITVVIVEDYSPETTPEAINTEVNDTLARKPSNVEIKTIRNTTNLGNCFSRNVAIAACNADIYIVIDADCLMNGDFVRSHVAQHLLAESDAVIGPYNIETNGEDAEHMLHRLECWPEAVSALSQLQDPLLPAAFVNTITRNLSVRDRWFESHGAFDQAFTYSAKPESGYGWEDVDIGARIYAANGKIRFTPQAFSIHQTHAPPHDKAGQARGSARNFRRLVEKHDFIRTVSRRWFVDTADRIIGWASAVDATSPDLVTLQDAIGVQRASVAPLLPYLRKERRRYRILTHRWHVPHQYEIYKLPFDFTLVTGTGTFFTNDWDWSSRPLPPNARFVPLQALDQSRFDMAIVHFDENVLSPYLSNGVLSADWGDTFRWFMENVKLPTVAVCHGTVPFVGQYGANPEPITNFELYEHEADRLRKMLADITVVVNSHQAAGEWRFNKSKVIWHGYDPQEFSPGSHELDIVCHGEDKARPHYRGAHQLRDVLAHLDPRMTVSTHKHDVDIPVASTDPRYPEFAFKSWVQHLGRHKIYLNTTLRSPMPRSRTEAMLCGVIPVSLDNHDVASFIEPGINGFYSSSTAELADFCRTLCGNTAMREKLSAAARATAVDLFNHDRFLTEWVTLVEEVTRG